MTSVRTVSDPELAIAGFYDHQQETAAPDWGGDELFTAPPRRRFDRAPQHQPRLREEPHPAPAPEPHVPYVPPRAPGRRTVTITGRPDGEAPRRPSRTIDERIAHRPERIASWICSIGALSILLAIVTAQ